MINQNRETVAVKPKSIFRRYKWFILLFLAFGCVYFLVEYFQGSTTSCVRYVKHNNTYEGKDVDCTTVKILPSNNTVEVRSEVHFQTNNLLCSGICLVIFIVILVCFVLPHNLGNYRTCCRRTTCCCAPITLREGIHRYMNGYIGNENHFKKVIQSCQEDLNAIVEGLKSHITEVTFDVMTTGSLQERLGKPTFIKLGKVGNLPMKSVLSSDFDVMLTPKLRKDGTAIMASRQDDPFNSCPTLFNVVNSPNAPPGFVWLRMNQDYQESRNMFWKGLCNESPSPEESSGLFLSSFEVRNIFVKAMKRIKRKVVGNFLTDWNNKVRNKGLIFRVKAQGPAVTVDVQERGNMFHYAPNNFRPILFYGDFIFAIRCTGWPQQAQEWPLRTRNWPPPAVICEVLDGSYHVVPKPSIPFLDKRKKKKDNLPRALQEYEWRLSYSVAEIILSKEIPPVARACLLTLKGTIKRYPIKTAGCVSSYELKTILFWALEQNPYDLWREERIEECFMVLVDILMECVTNRYCSHYFMPHVNLMANVQQRHLDCLSVFLLKLKKNPVKYVSSSNLRCLSNLAAFYECMYYDHGDDFYMDIY